MKRMMQLLTVSLFAFSLTLTSCKKDSEKNDGPGTQTCTDAAQEWSEASLSFQTGGTEEKCEAFKAAWENFLDKCDVGVYLSDEEYQEALDGINELDCSTL